MTVHRKSRMFVVSVFFCWSIVALLAAPPVFAAQVSPVVPAEIEQSVKYFFFLHNYYVETKGPDGDCKYHDLLQSFTEGGAVVISEIRTGKIVPCSYAKNIAGQVNQLLAAGVPPENITVAGHSKGGAIALCVASQLENEKINYVIMAGCEIAGIKKHNLYPDFSGLRGRILSIYASSDTIAGSCSQAFSNSGSGLADTEIELESDKGHQLFFAPETVWLEPMRGWLAGM
jgi:hypothetical protein